MEGVRRGSNRRRCCVSETVQHAPARRALPQALTLDDAAKPERKARSRLRHLRAARRAHRRKANPTAFRLASLERLALPAVGERGPQAIGAVVVRFLAAARPLAAVGDALGPAEAEPRA
jgi:hypothetical protein